MIWHIRWSPCRAGGDLSGTLAAAKIGQHNRIDLCYYSRATRGTDDQQALHNAFVATETLLGEELLDKWVGLIAVDSLREPKGVAKLLNRGRQDIRGLIPLSDSSQRWLLVASIQDQLSDKPLYVLQPEVGARIARPRVSWWKASPIRRMTIRYARICLSPSANMRTYIALHGDECFYSERYSRHGETFCYLKLDGAAGLEEEKFPDRASIEDALNEILVPARAGCVIGGGTGLRYSYIDLALADVDAALPLIKSRLRAGNINQRSWLLFFDAPLGTEWIGVYDESPAPP